MVGFGFGALAGGTTGFAFAGAGIAGLRVGGGAALFAGAGVGLIATFGLFEGGRVTSAGVWAGTVGDGGKAGLVGARAVAGCTSTGRLVGSATTSAAALTLLATSWPIW